MNRLPLRRVASVLRRQLSGEPTAVQAGARLRRLAARQPRYVGGTFRFPFGSLRYVDAASTLAQYNDIFVRRVYDFTAQRDAPVILDCGGNIGLSVIRFKQLNPRSRITVFEADPRIADVLAGNLAVAELPDVQLVRAAAWVSRGRVPFAADGADSGRVLAGADAEVDAVRLADFITGPTDLLKLDVEGAECDLLRDLCSTGAIDLIDCLICEFHGNTRTRPQLGSVMDQLLGHAFTFTVASARCARDLPGGLHPTPFRMAQDGKFLLQLYAWREGTRCGS